MAWAWLAGASNPRRCIRPIWLDSRSSRYCLGALSLSVAGTSYDCPECIRRERR